MFWGSSPRGTRRSSRPVFAFLSANDISSSFRCCLLWPPRCGISPELPAVALRLNELGTVSERPSHLADSWHGLVREVLLDEILDFACQQRFLLTGQDDRHLLPDRRPDRRRQDDFPEARQALLLLHARLLQHLAEPFYNRDDVLTCCLAAFRPPQDV